MGEKYQVKRRSAPTRSATLSAARGGDVVDLADWKRRRKVQEAGRLGLLRRWASRDDDGGLA